MVKGNLFHYRKNSWPPEEYVNRTTLQLVSSSSPSSHLLDFDSGAPPQHAWRRKLNSQAGILKEFSVTFMEALKMMRLGIRLWSYVREEASHGRVTLQTSLCAVFLKPQIILFLTVINFRYLQRAPIDPFNREGKPAATQGVPLGGMGSGSITRGFRGEFRQFQIIPGACEPSPMMANQFSIFISRDGGNKKYASVLSPGQHDGTGTDQGLSSWGWNLSGQHSTYHALFPRAWTVNLTQSSKCHAVKFHHFYLIITEIVVFLPLFLFTRGEDGVSGVLLHHKTAKENPPVTFAIAACETQNVNVTVLPSFGLSEESCVTAKDMWGKMGEDGQFDRENFNNGATFPSSAGEANCAAVSASTWVEPNGKCTVAFALAWSSPKVKFMKGKSYHRRYTKYYGTSERAAEDLVHDALTNTKADGSNGSSLTNSSEEDEAEVPERDDSRNPPSRSHDDDEDVGSFLYLEGVEYIMWCTYDVHFYASFALLELFPKIELSIQREFAKAVLSEDTRKVKFLAEGNSGIRKVKGAVPHDLGTHDPWHEMNAYNIHDTSKWKDLNPKFVLQVYRDFAATGNQSFGTEVWPAVCAAMDYMDQFDRDGDCLIENDGFPDQTYDAWTVHGISAYCGCLWLAALQATAAMAVQLEDKTSAQKYKSKFLKAKRAFEAKLWNGSYFNYDSGSSNNSKSIQADQLAGQWYTASAGLPNLFDDAKIQSSLQKIFDFNVMKVRGGRMGAVNGMHPNGKVDETCMQSREVWAGVTYGVAATMILAGMEEQAFTTAEGIFTAGCRLYPDPRSYSMHLVPM
ncbi:Beta-glucosidase, GBA2 type [Cynara cardunculus var. scolymus]|uniref:Beta-glucosidase, GBA2 type n=1 Tax=Cynara cardunculus var. scolymus TaxID=59895 RepID=A0A103YFR2_CYNCS|nr:Beta-glucosidase, GBA2 type [Cynara cardunculus var. scolymus]